MPGDDIDYGDLGPGFITWQPSAPPPEHRLPELEQRLLAIMGLDAVRETQSMLASRWAGSDIKRRIQEAGLKAAEVEVATLDAGEVSALLMHRPGGGAALAASFSRPGLFGKGVSFAPMPRDKAVLRVVRDGWIEYLTNDADTVFWVTAMNVAANPMAAAALDRFRAPDPNSG